MNVVLAYIGSEQGSWGNIAFPRPAHYYLMPGIRCCARTLRASPLTAATCTVRTRYYNGTVQSTGQIIEALTREKIDVLGMGCYCWNISCTLEVVAAVRERNPGVRILLGGPEVTLRTRAQVEAFHRDNPAVDALLFGEAEGSLPQLMTVLGGADRRCLEGTGGYALLGGERIEADFSPAGTRDVDTLPPLYPGEALPDIERTPACGIAVVYESARGCPYRCIYCQFAHRRTSIAPLPLERVCAELGWLLEQKVDCIHVADAVFDSNPQRCAAIVRFLTEHNRGTSLFFYCSFARLTDELAQLFARSNAQICVGIQSTNPHVLQRIERGLPPRLFTDVKEVLERHRLNFYVDLIFGLPDDSMDSYRTSFNQTVGLNPPFIMTFPLSLIRGTPLGDDPGRFDVEALEPSQVPAHELLCDIQYDNPGLGRLFSPRDLVTFDDVALALFYVHCRFPFTLSFLRSCAAPDVFELYRFTGSCIKQFLRRVGRRASNTDAIEGFKDEFFAISTRFLERCGCSSGLVPLLNELMRLDVYRLLMLESPARRRQFQMVQACRDACRTSNGGATRSLMLNTPVKIITLQWHLSELPGREPQGAPPAASPQTIMIAAPFERWDAFVAPCPPLERSLLEALPRDRPLPFDAALRAIRRGTGAAKQTGSTEVAQAIERLREHALLVSLATD